MAFIISSVSVLNERRSQPRRLSDARALEVLGMLGTLSLGNGGWTFAPDELRFACRPAGGDDLMSLSRRDDPRVFATVSDHKLIIDLEAYHALLHEADLVLPEENEIDVYEELRLIGHRLIYDCFPRGDHRPAVVSAFLDAISLCEIAMLRGIYGPPHVEDLRQAAIDLADYCHQHIRPSNR